MPSAIAAIAITRVISSIAIHRGDCLSCASDQTGAAHPLLVLVRVAFSFGPFFALFALSLFLGSRIGLPKPIKTLMERLED